jgi:N-acetylglucosamine-6-phosphate deacetylase
VFTLAASSAQAAPPNTRPVQGLRENTPRVHALMNARIIVAPGRVIEKGHVVVRDGSIEAVGDVKPPDDARVWDLEGKTVYAGLIDAFSEMSVDTKAATSGAPYWNDMVTPHLDVADQYKSDDDLNKKLREQGIGARLLAPSGRILKGTSAVVLTGDEENDQAIIKRTVAQHLRLTVPRGRGRENYPNSPMGAVALARQAMYDAVWYRRAWAAYRANTSLPRPEQNDALAALAQHTDSNGLFIADASNELYALRVDRYAREFSLNIVIRGSGHEYKRLDAIKATGRPVLVRVDFPKPPNVASAESALNIDLDDLMHWDFAPENPARLEEAGVQIAFTSYSLDDKGEFLAGVRKAVERGLPGDAALRAFTTTPASLFDVSDELGTI